MALLNNGSNGLGGTLVLVFQYLKYKENILFLTPAIMRLSFIAVDNGVCLKTRMSFVRRTYESDQCGNAIPFSLAKLSW